MKLAFALLRRQLQLLVCRGLQTCGYRPISAVFTGTLCHGKASASTCVSACGDHIKAVLGKSNSQCRFCDFEFHHIGYCRIHELNAHRDQVLASPREHEDLIHLLEDNKKAGRVCSYCNKILRRKVLLGIHEESCKMRDSVKRLVCKFCSQLFNTVRRRRDHELIVHFNEVKEYLVSAQSNADLNRLYNFKKKLGSVCSCCNRPFYDARQRINHELKLELRATNAHKCPDCTSSFRYLKGLNDHMLMCHRKVAEGVKTPSFEWVFSAENCTCRWCGLRLKTVYKCCVHEKKFHSSEPDYVPRSTFGQIKLLDDFKLSELGMSISRVKSMKELSKLEEGFSGIGKKKPVWRKDVNKGSSLLTYSGDLYGRNVTFFNPFL